MTSIATQSRSLQSDELQFATFRLGEMLLGIDIRDVSQISRVQEPMPVPHAPASVKGVINMRGEVVTLIDLGMVLGFPPIEITAHARQVIVRHEGESVGLLVDRLADIICVRPEDIDPRPENLNGLDARFFRGVCQLDRELLTVLDLEQTLTGVNENDAASHATAPSLGERSRSASGGCKSPADGVVNRPSAVSHQPSADDPFDELIAES